MVDLSPRAHIAHPLADSDKERLSSKQNLPQVPEETLKIWRFQLTFLSFYLVIHFLWKKNCFPHPNHSTQCIETFWRYKLPLTWYIICSVSLDTVDENGIFCFWLHWAMEQAQYSQQLEKSLLNLIFSGFFYTQIHGVIIFLLFTVIMSLLEIHI